MLLVMLMGKLMARRKIALVIFGALGCATPSFGYPSFIGYGYTSCIVCHFNPFGHGPLTDYGRALGATAIAAKPFYNTRISDQDYGEQSAFLGTFANLPDFLRLQLGYRGMGYTATGISRWIHMQSDASAIIRFREDKHYSVVTVGLTPAPAGTDVPDRDKVISREHYVSFLVKPQTRISLGMQDVVFGIRTVDHTAASRRITKLRQNDQVHGLQAHFGFSNAELGFNFFLGNLFQDVLVRPIGASAMAEIDIVEKMRLGFSALASTSSVRNRNAAAIHLRLGAGEGSSFLFETGLVYDNIKTTNTPTTGAYVYSQSMTRLIRGLHVLFTAEYSTPDTFLPTVRTFTAGPSIQYFPINRLELRSDLWGSRLMGQERDQEPPDSFVWLNQVHLWF